MKQGLKETLDLFFSIVDSLDLGVKLTETFGINVKWSEMIKEELLQFLTYLAASDGEISMDESTFLFEYLDVDFSPIKINEYICENNTYSVEFEEEPPTSLKVMVQIDNAFYEQEMDIRTTTSEALIEVYRRIGKAFIQCDGVEDEQEKGNLKIFLRTMREYAFDNLEVHKTPVKTGYGKKPRKVSKNDTVENMDCDVEAPKKEG